jgi:hypothetical protein
MLTFLITGRDTPWRFPSGVVVIHSCGQGSFSHNSDKCTVIV